MTALINGLGGTAGFGEGVLGRNDDGSTSFIDLTGIFENGLNFYGVTYTGIYVNNNGNVTFDNSLSQYTPTEITSGSTPGFFPFFADVDTSNSVVGAPTPGGTSQGTNLVYYDLDTANDRVVITWDDVGFFSADNSLLNAFQLVIEDASDVPGRTPGDFDFSFRYEDINWTTGDASDGSGGLGGSVARAGWSSGNGINFFELDASGDQEAILGLEEDPGNVGPDGFWSFSVANGDVTSTVFVRDGFLPQARVEGDSGSTQFLFEVHRVGDLTSTLSFDWGVVGGTADSADFVGGVLPSGTATFGVGEDVIFVPVNVAGDVERELDESFTFQITDVPEGVLTGDDDAEARIVTDDVPPQLSISDAIRTEGTGSGPTAFDFILTRTGDTTNALTVEYNIERTGVSNADTLADPDDLLNPALTGIVQFRSGEATAVLTVPVVADSIPEPYEDFFVNITNVLGDPDLAVVDGRGLGRILNDDGRPDVIPDGLEADLFGDPWLATFDGLQYGFQAVGEFVFVETMPGEADPFQIQARFERVDGSDLATVTTQVALEIAGARVTVSAGDPTPLRIDGVATDVTTSLDIDSDGTDDIFATGGGFQLVLDGGDQLVVGVFEDFLNVCVFLAPSRAGNIQGLLGNADGNTADDLTGRDGTLYPQDIDFSDLYGAFADSWRVDETGDTSNGKASLFDYPTGEGTSDYTDTGFPVAPVTVDDLPPALVAEATALLDAAGVTNPLLRNSAIIDYALTGNSDFIAARTVVAADPGEQSEPDNAPALGETLGVAAGASSVVEGDSGVKLVDFTIYRLGDTTQARTVNYTITGIDADDVTSSTPLTGSVSFDVGDDSAVITLGVVGDTTIEADETARVAIEEIVGISYANRFATTTIISDDNAPVARDDAFTISANATLDGDVLADNGNGPDYDPDGDATTATLTDDVDHGVLTFNADGTFDYAPDAAFVGTDTFSYELSDDEGGVSRTALVTIEVTDTPLPSVDATAETVSYWQRNVDNPGSQSGLTSTQTFQSVFGVEVDAAGAVDVTCAAFFEELLFGDHPGAGFFEFLAERITGMDLEPGVIGGLSDRAIGRFLADGLQDLGIAATSQKVLDACSLLSQDKSFGEFAGDLVDFVGVQTISRLLFDDNPFSNGLERAIESAIDFDLKPGNLANALSRLDSPVVAAKLDGLDKFLPDFGPAGPGGPLTIGGALAGDAAADAEFYAQATASYANASTPLANFIVDEDSLRVGIARYFGLDPVLDASDIEAELPDILGTVETIDSNDDGDLMPEEIVAAVQDVLDDDDAPSDDFGLDDIDLVTDVFGSLNNMPSFTEVF